MPRSTKGLSTENTGKRAKKKADYYATKNVYLLTDAVQRDLGRPCLNCGIDRMKFGQAATSGQNLRLVTKLETLANLGDAIKARIKFTIDVKKTGKKALESIAFFVYYFN